MMLGLLLGVKMRLLGRSLLRRSPTQTVIAALVLAAVLAPLWLGVGRVAATAVARYGADGALAVLGSVHLGWLVSAFLFSAFSEGLELRTLLRYPVRPATVFVLNVLLAPFDLVALFLVPPLAAAVVASGRLAGPGAAAGVALACVLTLLTTGVALHILLAVLGRFLRREWSRAVAGLVVGLAVAAPALLWQRSIDHDGVQPLAAAFARGVPGA